MTRADNKKLIELYESAIFHKEQEAEEQKKKLGQTLGELKYLHEQLKSRNELEKEFQSYENN